MKEIDDNEQYSRRNCLLIHGVKETEKEVTDTQVLNLINKELKIPGDKFSIVDIDRSHRLGKKSNDRQTRQSKNVP